MNKNLDFFVPLTAIAQRLDHLLEVDLDDLEEELKAKDKLDDVVDILLDLRTACGNANRAVDELARELGLA